VTHWLTLAAVVLSLMMRVNATMNCDSLVYLGSGGAEPDICVHKSESGHNVD
jgi:hypothetical protein